MAENIKFISLENLGLYDKKSKALMDAKDAEILEQAKAHAEDLSDIYDAAGSAATAESNAKAHAEEKVGELATYVGTIPEGYAQETVIAYINKKAEETLSAAQGGSSETAASVKQALETYKAENDPKVAALEGDVATIKGDYLKASDKEALQDSIDGVAEDVATIKGDYLKAADKSELQGKINAKVAQADYDAKMEELDGGIDGLQTQINTIMNNPDAEGAINSINEFTKYVTDHGEIAEGFRTDIDKNKSDIAAMDTAYKAADTAMQGRLDVLEAIDHNAYVGADTALKNELNGEIGKKADQTALNEAVEALEGADAGQIQRIEVLEGKFAGDNSVDSKIAAAKQEAIDTAAQDATDKANTAEGNAKSYADGLNTTMNGRVEALEAIDHDHENKSVLDGITSAKVEAWDAAEGNAKSYADGLNNTMNGRVEAIETWKASVVFAEDSDIEALFATA